MIRLNFTLVPFAALLLAPLANLHAVEPSSNRELPISFVKKHCADCHDANTSKGNFRADLLTKDLGDPKNIKAWSRVLARVQSAEMPPPKKTQRPTEA